ncbi:MAG: hypothetical protein GX568_00760 [Candidatus Gastranaerophilales bacterium]|nr:hypothetical protein [Candidatus Gastranaerophilales bacterium]
MQTIGFKGAIVTSEPSCKNYILNSYYKDKKAQKSYDKDWKGNKGNLASKYTPVAHKYSDNCSFYLNPADNFRPHSNEEPSPKLYLWNKDYHTFNKFLVRNAHRIPTDIVDGKYGSPKPRSDVEKYMIRASKLAEALVEAGKIPVIENRNDVGNFVHYKTKLNKNVLNDDILNKALDKIAVEPQKVEAEPVVKLSVPVEEGEAPVITAEESAAEEQSSSSSPRKPRIVRVKYRP